LDICAETGQAGFDLVWSVECLEHIKDDALAVHNACSFVRPGGQLLLIVPFANQQEQKDPSVIQGERRFGHVVAGYDADRLTQLIGRDQFNEIRLENCYWRETYALRLYRNAVFPAMGSRVLVQLEALARTDIRPGALAENRTQALGIKVLATGRRSGTEQRRGYQGLFSPQGSGEGLYPADRNPSGMIGLASKVAGMATAGIGRCR
jgi:SAM-dependent methyltransferase